MQSRGWWDEDEPGVLPLPHLKHTDVIRRPEDHGTVFLMDVRFARPEVRALLPAWWRVE